MFYNEIDKLIYETPSGTKYDPLALYRRIIAFSSGNINSYLSSWSDPEQTEVSRVVAEEQLVDVARKVFDFKPFSDPAGVVDGVALNTLLHFLEWLEKKGQKAETEPEQHSFSV